MSEIVVIHPAQTMDELATALVTLTEHIVNKDPEREVDGFLGGRFGYGAAWSSPVFDMRPYCWDDCDCDSGITRTLRYPHKPKEGLQTRARMNRFWREYEALYVAHPCLPTCCTVLPNFRHHATGLEVRWYKYIGRSMEVTGCEAPDVPALLAECIADVGAPPFTPWVYVPPDDATLARWASEWSLDDADDTLSVDVSEFARADDDIPF